MSKNPLASRLAGERVVQLQEKILPLEDNQNHESAPFRRPGKHLLFLIQCDDFIYYCNVLLLIIYCF